MQNDVKLRSPFSQDLRVLMYHAIGDRDPTDSYGLSVACKDFEAQLDLILELGMPLVQLADGTPRLFWGDHSKSGIAITFDDGYKNNLDGASALIARKMPFVIYCIASEMDKPQFLSSQDLRDLAKTGYATIGGHGLTHRRLGDLSSEEQNAELVDSKKRLEDILGEPIHTMSLPHGSLNKVTMELAQRAGFELVATSRPGLNKQGRWNPFHVKRTELRSQHTLEDFKGFLRGSDDWREWVYMTRAVCSPWVRSQWKPFS